jgi:predicted AAA+ superfamily ATPase
MLLLDLKRSIETSEGSSLCSLAKSGTQIELFYWREGDKDVDFVLKCGDTITAIEVKSGLANFRESGIDLFVKEFKPSRMVLVGTQGIPVEDFLKVPITDFVG